MMDAKKMAVKEKLGELKSKMADAKTKISSSGGADSKALMIGTIGTILASFLILIVLFFWAAASNVFAMEAKDDGDDRWWDMDLTREEEAALKIVVDQLVLVIAVGTLAKPILNVWHPAKGRFDRFNLGVLAASLFMVGNMCFISFWFTVNYKEKEEDENNNNNNNNGDEDAEMDEEELLLYYQKVVCVMSFLLAATLTSLSIFIYYEGKKIPETRANENTDEHVQLKASARMELIGDFWKLLSASTVTIVAALYITACVLSGGEEAEKAREEGLVFNLISVLTWVMIVTTGNMIIGRKILGEKKLDGVLGVGLLSGGSLYYALLLLMVSILYANPAFKDQKKNEDGIGATIATSFACFFLSLIYVGFTYMTYKYQSSIIGAITEDVEMVKTDDTTANDFQRMDDGQEKNVDENAGGFKIMDDEPESSSEFEKVENEGEVV